MRLPVATATLVITISLFGDSVNYAESRAEKKTEPVTIWDTLPAEMPQVLLTETHQALCKVVVGDKLPSASLAKLDGTTVDLRELYGKTATVLCFWTASQQMARMELADLETDAQAPFGRQGVSVVAIAVKEMPETASAVQREMGITYPILIDRDGSAVAKVGSTKLPRTYLLDSKGTIVWFDLEYSMATRRELRQALQALKAK